MSPSGEGAAAAAAAGGGRGGGGKGGTSLTSGSGSGGGDLELAVSSSTSGTPRVMTFTGGTARPVDDEGRVRVLRSMDRKQLARLRKLQVSLEERLSKINRANTELYTLLKHVSPDDVEGLEVLPPKPQKSFPRDSIRRAPGQGPLIVRKKKDTYDPLPTENFGEDREDRDHELRRRTFRLAYTPGTPGDTSASSASDQQQNKSKSSPARPDSRLRDKPSRESKPVAHRLGFGSTHSMLRAIQRS
jgi:hypothetical protein